MLLRCLATAALALLTTAPLAAAPRSTATTARFDGAWTVAIVTERGSCERAFGIPLRIRRGYVGPRGNAQFAVWGRVSRDGFVNVTVSRGPQSANGRGRLAGRRGTGTWRSYECAGNWTATKAY